MAWLSYFTRCKPLKSDIDFDLKRSPKVTPNDAIALPIYDFLLVFKSNV